LTKCCELPSYLIAPYSSFFPRVIICPESKIALLDLLFQLGVPANREQYIHRLGRTGRKGKEGKGILMLAPQEKHFLSSIKDLPLPEVPLPSADPNIRKKVSILQLFFLLSL